MNNERNLNRASDIEYDLIILGGGIYGTMLLMEANRRHLRCLLLERDDFGSATSFNWLRILHGGFRYLQTVNLRRFRESVSERSWFIRTFPDLVQPLPCLMPLYGKGLKRPYVLRIASKINDWLSHSRNDGLEKDKILPNGKVISATETLKLATGIRSAGLKGGVIWYDALMPDSQLLIKTVLKWATDQKAVVLNYMSAESLQQTDGNVSGVFARDRETGKRHLFSAPCVVNTTGPWSRRVAATFHKDIPSLFHYSKAWNVWFKRNAVSKCGLALTPDRPGARTYFLVPWKERLVIGTGHAACATPDRHGKPALSELKNFIDDINDVLPDLHLSINDVQYIFSGLLPADTPNTDKLAVHEVIVDHSKEGGVKGLYSVSGVKFTTARLVAKKVLQKIFPTKKQVATVDKKTFERYLKESHHLAGKGDGTPLQELSVNLNNFTKIAKTEAVVHLDDLIFRRTNLWEKQDLALQIAKELTTTMNWNEHKANKELLRLQSALDVTRKFE
jgi:glycerol-3-phosphate dehydrogenase